MAGVFNDDESTEDDIDVGFHLGERLRINRGENSNFSEENIFKNSKDLKQYFNMRRKKLEDGQCSSNIEMQSDTPSSGLCSADNYHNKKRHNGDKSTEQLANPKRTCLSNRFPRTPVWRDYFKKVYNHDSHNHDSKSETSLFPDSFYLHQETSPDIFKKSEEYVNNSLADAEDSDIDIPVKINQSHKTESGHSSKNGKIQFPGSNRAWNFENKASTSYCSNNSMDSVSKDEGKPIMQNGTLKGGQQELAVNHIYDQSFKNKSSINYFNKFLDSDSEEESESIIQNGALKGGQPDSVHDHSYSKNKVGHKINKKVLDSDESEDDDDIPLSIFRSKLPVFSSSDSEDFKLNRTKNKLHGAGASHSSNGSNHSYDGNFDGNTGSHSRQFKPFQSNQKFSKKAFNSLAANNKAADSSDGCDRQFPPPDFQHKSIPHRTYKSRRNARTNTSPNFPSSSFPKNNSLNGPIRGRRISATERGQRRSGSPHHRSNRCQHKSDENKCRGRSVSRSRAQNEKPNYAIRFPDVFDAEESENEFFTANSYSDTETSTESLAGLTANTNFPNHTSSASCSVNCENRDFDDASSDDEISVVFSTGPYGRNNETRRGISRTLGRRHSRGTPHRQLQNTREIVSLSPDPVEQVRQMEEDERMARMLQAQFDAEIDPNYVPMITPSISDDSDGIIDPIGDSDTDERSFSSPERSVSPFAFFSIDHRGGLGLNQFSSSQRFPPPTAAILMGHRIDPRYRRRILSSRRPVPQRDIISPSFSRIWTDANLYRAESILNDYEALLTLDVDDEAAARGLATSQINRLPTRKYIHPNSTLCSNGSEVSHRRTELNKECQVCLTDYETGDTLRILPCFHEFHIPCIDPWLTINHTCPVCRVTVDLDA